MVDHHEIRSRCSSASVYVIRIEVKIDFAEKFESIPSKEISIFHSSTNWTHLKSANTSICSDVSSVFRELLRCVKFETIWLFAHSFCWMAISDAHHKVTRLPCICPRPFPSTAWCEYNTWTHLNKFQVNSYTKYNTCWKAHEMSLLFEQTCRRIF